VTHIANHIPRLYLTALRQPFCIGVVLTQMGIIIIAFLVETPDPDAPSAITVPSQSFYIA